MRITKNFRLDEFLHRGDTAPPLSATAHIVRLADRLQTLRDVVGRIDITSGYRSPVRNHAVGGSKDSYHLDGLAADIVFDWSDWSVSSLSQVLRSIGFTNVNFYLNAQSKLVWIHADIGESRQSDFFYTVRDAKTHKIKGVL